MIITLSPKFGAEPLRLIKRNDTLNINGETFDFTTIPEGAVLPAAAINCEYIIGDITRSNGHLIICLMLPCGPDSSDAANFPEDIVNPRTGHIGLPE